MDGDSMIGYHEAIQHPNFPANGPSKDAQGWSPQASGRLTAT